MLALINKRALSNLVAYVLLIGMAIALAIMIYGWLKFYVDDSDVLTCPDNVNLVIDDYQCFDVGMPDSELIVGVKNKGFFGVDGYKVRIHDKLDADFGFYLLDEHMEEIAPGDVVSKIYDISSYAAVTLIEVQPIILTEKGDVINCETRAFQKVSGC